MRAANFAGDEKATRPHRLAFRARGSTARFCFSGKMSSRRMVPGLLHLTFPLEFPHSQKIEGWKKL